MTMAIVPRPTGNMKTIDRVKRSIVDFYLYSGTRTKSEISSPNRTKPQTDLPGLIFYPFPPHITDKCIDIESSQWLSLNH